jgi:hypothetical protein
MSRPLDPGDELAAYERGESARMRPLRLYLRPGSEELHQYRISAIFEAHPEVDHIVIAMVRNGFETIADLHGCEVRRAFAGIDAPLHEQRWVLERLKAHLRLIDAF